MKRSKRIHTQTLLYLLKKPDHVRAGYAMDALTQRYGKEVADLLKEFVWAESLQGDYYDRLLSCYGIGPKRAQELAVGIANVRSNENMPIQPIMELYRSGSDELSSMAVTSLVESFQMYVYDLIHHGYPTYAEKMMPELFQSGIEGLLKSLPSYDESKGEFTTYCKNYILHELNRQVNFYHNDLTPHYYNAQKQIQSAINRLRKEGSEISEKKLQILTGLSPERISKELDYMNRTNFRYLNDDEDTGLKEIEDSYSKNPEAIAENNERVKELYDSIDALPQPERDVIYLKFMNDASNEQIAEQLHITIGQAKASCNNALRILRKNKKLSRTYTDYSTNIEREMQQNAVPVMPSSEEASEELSDLAALSELMGDDDEECDDVFEGINDLIEKQGQKK